MKKNIFLGIVLLLLSGCQYAEQPAPSYNVSVTENQMISNPSVTQNQSSFFEFKNLKTGDMVGKMIVTKIEPATKSLSIDQSNYRITFKGNTNIRGQYHHYGSGEGILANIVCMNQLDPASLAELPRMINDQTSVSFCFRNNDYAEQQFNLPGTSGTAEVTIDNYEYVQFSSEAYNQADLVKVVGKIKTKELLASGFLEKIINNMPKTYLQSSGLYPDRPMDNIKKKTFSFQPCESVTGQTLCRTTLEIWEEAIDQPSEDYLKKNAPFDTYEKIHGGELTKSRTKNGIDYTSTDFMMCFGTGAESCRKKEYIFFYRDQSIARAVISYWPFNSKDEFLNKPPVEIQKIIDFYEKLLLNQ